MIPHEIQTTLLAALKNHTSTKSGSLNIQPIGGGSINNCFRLSIAGNHNFFCKINSASKFPHLFRTERDGLLLIEQQKLIATPKIIDLLQVNDQQILILEWINPGERSEKFWENFGQQLAALHQKSNDHFGLSFNNYMGSIPQINHPCNDWISFFRDNRLQPLVNDCLTHHLLTSRHAAQFDKLFQLLPTIFDFAQKPSLVHGDLWSGNFMCNQHSQPVLIDPAPYYGHPSVDLAMTTLFGGFHQLFYDAYQSVIPYPYNFCQQWQVCNLYPLLIHLRLFGSSYLSSISQALNAFS